MNNKISTLDNLIKFFLENKILTFMVIIIFVGIGIIVAPFDWHINGLPRNPVSVDAIPDIGENQQIVFTDWMGRSPQDIEDQVTYPLTTALLGIPGVKTIRSYSMFGFSSIYVIFDEDVEFYWSRSRIIEKLNSLPMGILPDGVKPVLGPDATALGQVFWYTVEGMDENNNPTGGWGLDELRSVQDWYIRYSLMSAKGISEVASVGGYVKEFQIDIDPDAMQAYGVGLTDVFRAVKQSNIDVGARTIEVNKVEYVIRGIGFIKSVSDIENAVIKASDNVPVYVKNIANVSLGPALRRGALDKEGAEVVGGVAVVRYGENPLVAIKNLKEKILEISPGLPQKTLPDGTVSKLQIVPFYDRTTLIHETLETLNKALVEEILITIIVVLVMVRHLRSSLLISGLLPLAVLMCFIGMKQFSIDANIVALSGIAIAIGTMVDMGIIVTENILRHLSMATTAETQISVIFRATREVGSAILTAVSTTVISFLPVFTMEAAEGKLFKPIAFTKTFALIASVIVALAIIPAVAHVLFPQKKTKHSVTKNSIRFNNVLLISAIAMVLILLSNHWAPLGASAGRIMNTVFTGLLTGILLLFFYLFHRAYPYILKFSLNHKVAAMVVPLIIVITGAMSWSGLGKEFMPPLNEGSFLFMPTTMPHASIGEALDIIHKQDMAIRSIPEIRSVVGKIGRAETPLDPAPLSMIETIIDYYPEFYKGSGRENVLFEFDSDEIDKCRDFSGKEVLAPDGRTYNVKGKYTRNESGQLVPDAFGKPFRLWRNPLDESLNSGRVDWAGIQNPDDIWEEILNAAKIPGTTSAPKLQPIAARLVMLQSGMRAPMGVKIKGPDLETIESVGLQIEKLLKEVPFVDPSMVFADRIIGKPYLEFEIDRIAIARYGITLQQIQNVIEVAIGGKKITTTIEGRERYPVRIRYQRELRDTIESLDEILVSTSNGAQIPIMQLAKVNYVRGPQMIKSEDTFLIGFVLFDKRQDVTEVDAVEAAKEYLEEKIVSGDFVLPEGVNYSFSGNYVNQVRSEKRLKMVLPLALFLIFMILYFQFKNVSTALLVFLGVAVAWGGGFILIWLYAQPWFLDFSLFGTNMRALFQVHPVNLSVAIWVGFLALFGIATDDGVVMATYLNQTFKNKPRTVKAIRTAAFQAGNRRVRACLMTTATTVLALLPVMTSQGRGSDIMIPMAIPSFGGMLFAVVTMFVVPVIYCWIEEIKLGLKSNSEKDLVVNDEQ